MHDCRPRGADGPASGPETNFLTRAVCRIWATRGECYHPAKALLSGEVIPGNVCGKHLHVLSGSPRVVSAVVNRKHIRDRDRLL